MAAPNLDEVIGLETCASIPQEIREKSLEELKKLAIPSANTRPDSFNTLKSSELNLFNNKGGNNLMG